MQENKKPKIMIVDDDTFILDIYTLKFRNQGYEIQTANSGKETIKQIEGGYLPDILLLDVVMPEMSGVELLEYFKQNNLLKNTVKILLTNDNEADSSIRNSGLEVDQFLIKALQTPTDIFENVVRLYNDKKYAN